MRLLLSLLLAESISYAANASPLAQSRSRPAIVQSLSTGIYRPATVIFEGNRAKIRFNRGGQIVLDLDNPVTTESEEIVGVDQSHNYWAVYVDNEAPGPELSASFSGLRADDLLDPPKRGAISPHLASLHEFLVRTVTRAMCRRSADGISAKVRWSVV